MRIITGDETGLLKCVDVRKKRVLARWGKQSREGHVSQILLSEAFGGRVVSQTKPGIVEMWDPSTQTRLHRCAGTGSDSVLLAQLGTQYLTVSPAGEVRLFDEAATDATDSIKVNTQAKHAGTIFYLATDARAIYRIPGEFSTCQWKSGSDAAPFVV